MVYILWDASALVKRYFAEAGRESVNAIFRADPNITPAATYFTYLEVAAILRRRLNSGDITPKEFRGARLYLRREVLEDPDFLLLSLEDQDNLNALDLVDRHNLNASDAVVLATYLRLQQGPPASERTCLLVATDRRLLRAAAAEGLNTANPELIAAADVPSLLLSL